MDQQPQGNPPNQGYIPPPPQGYQPPPGYQPPGYQPYPPAPPPRPQKSPNTTFAVLSLVFGIFAMFLPIPVVDVMLGVAGIVLSIIALNSGSKGLAIAGLICSIIGTLLAISFTLDVLGVIPDAWLLLI